MCFPLSKSFFLRPISTTRKLSVGGFARRAVRGDALADGCAGEGGVSGGGGGEGDDARIVNIGVRVLSL